jgi:hypothetical protein
MFTATWRQIAAYWIGMLTTALWSATTACIVAWITAMCAARAMMPADAAMLALVRRRQLPERRIKTTKSFVAAWILTIPGLTRIADAVNCPSRNHPFARLRSLDPKPAALTFSSRRSISRTFLGVKGDARIFSSSHKSINP